jgi:cytochrome b561
VTPGVLIVVRIVWRLTHAPIPWDRPLPMLAQRAATLGHAALYACMLAMPLSRRPTVRFAFPLGALTFLEPMTSWSRSMTGQRSCSARSSPATS